jgi:hypothetical protein
MYARPGKYKTVVASMMQNNWTSFCFLDSFLQAHGGDYIRWLLADYADAASSGGKTGGATSAAAAA